MVKLNKIYTRTGDDGLTGLVDGSRVRKDTPLLDVIGDVDEANSVIGSATVHAENAMLRRLRAIQNDMFDLGADLATPPTIVGALRIVAAQVDRLESEIDVMNAELEPLTSFILPGGTPLATSMHLARTVVRRAERRAIGAQVTGFPAAYLNRLSDWLFVAARVANANGRDDILWVPGASRG